MTEPISHATESRGIGQEQRLSQASSAANAGGAGLRGNNGQAQPRHSAHLLKLRHYVKELQGMLLDTSA